MLEHEGNVQGAELKQCWKRCQNCIRGNKGAGSRKVSLKCGAQSRRYASAMIKTILNGSISTRAAADNLRLGQLLKYRRGPARHDLSRHRSYEANLSAKFRSRSRTICSPEDLSRHDFKRRSKSMMRRSSGWIAPCRPSTSLEGVSSLSVT